ncbi:unnamed protein product [Orchesella dallaii]|uniref:Uncharacterized protein n=1 Tax=Orchesella dallaii TaxID=48710 RepID=A0ABP1QBC6_9HEXA
MTTRINTVASDIPNWPTRRSKTNATLSTYDVVIEYREQQNKLRLFALLAGKCWDPGMGEFAISLQCTVWWCGFRQFKLKNYCYNSNYNLNKINIRLITDRPSTHDFYAKN